MPDPRRPKPGDLIELRKGHPCGANQWEIIRAGMDVQLRCTGCGRYVILPRVKFERRLKQFIEPTNQDGSQS